jgi:hypothetical protein
LHPGLLVIGSDGLSSSISGTAPLFCVAAARPLLWTERTVLSTGRASSGVD